MGINLKNNQSIFIDTAPLIYFWEKHEKYYPAMAALFDEVYAKDIQCMVSLITYIEVITLPLKKKEQKIAAKYRNYLNSSRNFQLAPLNIAVADRTAFFRSKYNLKTPDAIQLATADICGADFVLANDHEWKIAGTLNVILVDELVSEKYRDV